jgi:hypothetical protein
VGGEYGRKAKRVQFIVPDYGDIKSALAYDGVNYIPQSGTMNLATGRKEGKGGRTHCEGLCITYFFLLLTVNTRCIKEVVLKNRYSYLTTT